MDISIISVMPLSWINVSHPIPKLHFQLNGVGYLAGNIPSGIVTVEGVPSSAYIRVLLRDRVGSPMDGAIVAEAISSQDGTWRVNGLPAHLKYDVVGRKDGFNDVIMSDVSPAIE